MAKSSKFLRLDTDVLLEFIYHDQSNTSASTIEIDNNGSHIKFLNTDALDDSKTRYLIHELGGDVVNFTVTTISSYVSVNNFARRELQLQNGKTYIFDVSALSDPSSFTISAGGSITYNLNGTITYVPNTNGNYTYSYVDTVNNLTYSGGSIVVSDKANPLFATPNQETGNTIKTGVGEVGRYYAIQNNLDGTNFALLDNPLTYLSSSVWNGTTNLVNESLNSNLVNYDTVRLHLRTGFSFSGRGYEGFLFQVKAKRYSGIYNYFTSLAYLNYSNFEIQNPKPFVISGVAYSKFIEVKVPSLVDMYDNTLNLDFQDAFFGTGQNAVDPTSNYEIVFKLIDKITEINNVKYIDCSENLNVTVSQEDEYQDISAVIEEAIDGDYFKIYGLKDGSIDNFAKYINLRQQTGGDDIVAFHDIEVLEQIGTTFTQTSTVTYAQVDNFDNPIVYRPVIQSANVSNSFLINYNLRIYNETDNTQILKQASLIYNKPSKYAKRMIQLNVNGELTHVYNKIASTTATTSINNFINSIRPSIGETKYVPVAVDTLNVVSANTNVQLDGTNVTALNNLTYFGLGQGVITLSKVSDNFIKLRIAQKEGDTLKEISLVNAEKIEMIIKSGAVEQSIFSDPTFPNVDMGKGEVLFKIEKSVANKFDQPETNIASDTFYINIVNGSTNSMLYYGKVNIV
jgi:hypothetical protein